MQKTRKGQLCLQKVTIAMLRPVNSTGWAITTDGEFDTKPTATLVPTGQTQTTSSDVPTCRFYTQK